VVESRASINVRLLASPGRWVVASVFGVAIGSTRGLTYSATSLVVAAGVGLWMVGRYAAPPPRPPVGDVAVGGLAVWATIFVIFCLLDLAVFLLGNNADFPTFSMLVNPIVTWSPTRAITGVGWLAWGWYLLER